MPEFWVGLDGGILKSPTPNLDQFPGFRHQFVATRLAWESLCTRAYVMHAHYDVLLCISVHRNKKN